MGCTMHFWGWAPYVGSWHPCWVSMAPLMTILYFGHFLSFPLMGLHPPRVIAIQAYTDFLRWPSFRTVGKYCSRQNPSVGGSDICLYTHKLCLWPCLPHICGSRPQWEMATVSHPVTAISMNMRGTHIHNLPLNIESQAPWASPRFGGIPCTHKGRSHNCFPTRHVWNRATCTCDCCKCGQYKWDFLCLGLFMWARCNFTSKF